MAATPKAVARWVLCSATIRMRDVLPHPGTLPNGPSIASSESSRRGVTLSIGVQRILLEIQLMWAAAMMSLCKQFGERPGAKPVSGRLTGRGHRRPRLYRDAIVIWSSAGFKYPGGLGAAPPCLRPDQGGNQAGSVMQRDYRHPNRSGVNGDWRLPRCLSGGCGAEHHFMRHLTPPLFQPAL